MSMASPFQKLLLSVGSSITSLQDPHRHETTGTDALQHMLATTPETEEGPQILTDKPRINTKTVDLDRLRSLPDGSFGRAYVQSLDDNELQTRLYLAYVMTRYRECHDLVHTILGMLTNMLGEDAVRWVEAFNTGLPMCYDGAVFGAARLGPKF